MRGNECYCPELQGKLIHCKVCRGNNPNGSLTPDDCVWSRKYIEEEAIQLGKGEIYGKDGPETNS